MRLFRTSAVRSLSRQLCVMFILAVILAVPSAAIEKDKRVQDDAPSPSQPLTLAVYPAQLTLDMARHGQVLLLARSADGTTITSAELSFIPIAGLATPIAKKPAMPATGDLVWIVDVDAAASVPSTVKLVAQLTYNAEKGPPGIAVVTVTVTTPSPISLGELKTTLLPADGLMPLDLTFAIENPTRQAARIKDFRVLAPASVSFVADINGKQPVSRPLLPSPIDAAPGGSLAIPLHVVAGAALPGTYTLVIGFDVAFSNQPEQWLPATVQSKVVIQVPGVSEALQFIGSLLLLPGVLAVLTFITFFAWVAREAPIDWKNPFLLVVSVMLSYGASKAYAWWTDRNILAGYEMNDVVNLWLGSVTVGAVGGFGAGAFTRGIRWLHDWWQPQLKDKPIDILRKLGRHGVDFWLPAVQRGLGTNADAQFMLVLPFGKAGPGRRWLVQRTLLGQGDADGAVARLQRIADILNGPHGTACQTRALVKEVAAGWKEGQVTLAWEGNPGMGPFEAAAADHPVWSKNSNGGRTCRS
jgi:hypothetical protein